MASNKEAILERAWNATIKPTSSGFINVSDQLSKTKRYVYTNSVPTYKEIQETEALLLVNRWLERLYGEAIPPEINNTNFENRFLGFLTQRSFYTKEAFKALTPVGEPLKNTYASLEFNSPQIVQKQYSPEIVVLQEPIKSNYSPVVCIDDNDGSKVVINRNTMNLLKVICGESQYNLTVFRILIRNIITAPYEGKNWQSAVYLHGAPGTGKSVWVGIIKRLVPEDAIQEFNRHQNTFSAGQFENCQVLIISDLIYLTSKQVF